MTINCYFLTMPKSLTMALLAYDGFQLLDVTGPVAVFAAANHELKGNFYKVEVLSPAGGAVASDSGLAVQTRAIARMPDGQIDTLLIAGAEEAALRAVIANTAVRRWVPRRAVKARRVGSVCSGTFILAALGSIDRRRGATQWEGWKLLTATVSVSNVRDEPVSD